MVVPYLLSLPGGEPGKLLGPLHQHHRLSQWQHRLPPHPPVDRLSSPGLPNLYGPYLLPGSPRTLWILLSPSLTAVDVDGNDVPCPTTTPPWVSMYSHRSPGNHVDL